MTKNYNKSIILDIDGVLADFEEEFCDRFGYDARDKINLEERYPDAKDLIDEFVESSETYANLKPIWGGWLLSQQAKERGYYVILATSRPERVQEATRIWLEQYNVAYNEVWFTKTKTEQIQRFNVYNPSRRVLFMVDDIVSNFDGLTPDVIGVAYHQPYNGGYYPRMWYDEKSMTLRIKTDTESKDRDFWS